MPVIEAPQLVTASRMLYFTWVPADPDAVRALVPEELELLPNSQCFINQYVVDSAEQTSAFEAYSLTYAGADLAGHDTPDGAVPGTLVDALLQLERGHARRTRRPAASPRARAPPPWSSRTGC